MSINWNCVRPMVLGLFCIVAAGCDPAVNVPADARPDAGSSVTESGPNPEPATWSEIVGVVDLRKFPVMVKAVYVQQNAAGSHFTLPMGDVAQAIDFHKAKLAEFGWKPESDPKLWQVLPQGAQLFFNKNGQRLYASIGVSGDGNLNAGLFHLANIDARRFPRTDVAELVEELPSRVIYRTLADGEKIRKFMSEELAKQGWQEFRRPPIKGLPPGMGGTNNEARFLKGAVGVDVMTYPVDGKTQVMTGVRVLPNPLPVMTEARAVEYEEDPVQLTYATPADVDAVLAFYRKEMPKLGWKEDEAASKKDAERREGAKKAKVEKPKDPKAGDLDDAEVVTLRFDAPDRRPLRFEVLHSGEVSFVRFTPWPEEKK